MNLVLSLTHACNLRCSYCYGGAKSQRHMRLEVARKALDLAFAAPGPVVRVMPFGGEPLLRVEMLEALASEARQRAAETGKLLRLVLITNGTLLTDSMLDDLEAWGYQINVSIDGDGPAHDRARVFPDGSGSFNATSEGLARAQRRGHPVRTISVVHPDNLDRLPASFDYLAALGIRQLSFNLDYGACWEEAALPKIEVAYEALADRAACWYRNGHDVIVQPLHRKIVTRLKGGYADQDRCDFGCEELAVAPSGRLYPCDRLIGEDGPKEQALVIGDVEHGVDHERVWALKEKKDQPKPDCLECALLDRCMWWCGCVNHALTGQVDRVDGFLCATEQIFARVADRMAATLYSERVPTFMSRYYLATFPV